MYKGVYDNGGGGRIKAKLYTKMLGVFASKMVLKNVGSVPMKVGWVSKYDTSMVQCL